MDDGGSRDTDVRVTLGGGRDPQLPAAFRLARQGVRNGPGPGRWRILVLSQRGERKEGCQQGLCNFAADKLGPAAARKTADPDSNRVAAIMPHSPSVAPPRTGPRLPHEPGDVF